MEGFKISKVDVLLIYEETVKAILYLILRGQNKLANKFGSLEKPKPYLEAQKGYFA